MLKCYTISSLKALYELPNLDVCQFTLNYRTAPGRRKTVELLKTLSSASQTRVVVHYDFIYIASRYAMFAESIRKDTINELCDIFAYSAFDNRIIGIVMHTDFPISKEVLDNFTEENIRRKYGSSFWEVNPKRLIRIFDNVVNYNLHYFCTDLENELESRGIKTNMKLYLENTTKVGPKNQGSFESLYGFWMANKYPHIGLCLDSEHYYAVEGEFPWNIDNYNVPLLYHLNTIPPEVGPGSKKDRHSFTTLSECSINTLQQYLQFIDRLENKGITYIREVKEETMFREIEQLNELGIYGR